MPATQKALIHPVIDFLMIGGLSIFLIPVILFFHMSEHLSQDQIITLIFISSFLFSMPHFAASYQLFYVDHRERLWKSWPWVLIGTIIPAMLIIFLGVCYALSSFRDIAFLVSLMFLLVGWHYTKQVYGCIVVMASRHSYDLNKAQRICLKINLATLWLSSLGPLYRQNQTDGFYTMRYPFIKLPEVYTFISYGLVLISLVIFLVVTFLRYRRERSRLPWMSWVPFVALYFWYTPMKNGAFVLILLPIFHALQYLLFVITYKKNECAANHTSVEGLKRMTWFFMTAFLLGTFFMDLIPRVLDLTISLKVMDITIFLIMFNVFINIHHYFLDFLLWRRNVPEFKKYLLAPGPSSN